MKNSRILGTLSLAATLALAGTASAQSVDINGGSSWGGWDLRGQSNQQGIYGSGSAGIVYELYTTSFLFNGQTVSGSPAFGGAFTAPMDLSGFQTGARILGVGVRAVSGLPAWSGSGPWATNPFVIFDLNKDSYSAASTVGGTDGRASPSTYGHAGDFNVQANGDYNNLYRPNVMTVFTDNGTFWGGSGSFTGYAGSSPTHATTLWPDVRSFFDPSNGSWQMLFNLDTLENTRGIGAIGNEFRIMTAVNSGSADNRSVLDVSIVPAPGAFALLGLAGLAGARRRR